MNTNFDTIVASFTFYTELVGINLSFGAIDRK